MAEALLLNKITKLAGEPQDAQAFRILLSEDAVRLAKQSRFGPIHHTAMFSVQAIVAAGPATQAPPPSADSQPEASSVLAWVVRPKFKRVVYGATFMTVVRRAMGFSEAMAALHLPPGANQREAMEALAKWVKVHVHDGATPIVTAYLEGLLVIEVGDLAGVLIAVQPDNMSI